MTKRLRVLGFTPFHTLEMENDKMLLQFLLIDLGQEMSGEIQKLEGMNNLIAALQIHWFSN